MDLTAFGIRTTSHEAHPKTPQPSPLVEQAPRNPATSEYRKPLHDSTGARIGDQLPLVTPHEANYGYEVDPVAEVKIRKKATSPTEAVLATAQFKDYTLRYAARDNGLFSIEANHPTDTVEPAGSLYSQYEQTPGVRVAHAPAMIWTSEGHQGKGLARAMFRFGQAMQGGNFQHSIERTPEGYGYSTRVPDDPDQDPARIVPTTRTEHFHQGRLF